MNVVLALILRFPKDKGYAKMVEEVEANGGQVVFPVQLPPASAYMLDGQPATILAIRKYRM